MTGSNLLLRAAIAGFNSQPVDGFLMRLALNVESGRELSTALLKVPPSDLSA